MHEGKGEASSQQILLYQRKVGSLLYATTITRPEVARTANKLSEFLMNPSSKHHEAADKAISYLIRYEVVGDSIPFLFLIFKIG